jgi:hypothetical protein
MHATWLADVCRSFGLRVIETPGWQTRGRADFEPRGIVCHHTAGPATGNMPSLRTLVNGRADLPGPLCNVGLARDGTVVVVAAGTANHAGRGSWRGVSANRHVIGIEAENDGSQPWPDVQLREYQRLCAAMLRHLGLPAEAVCGHREWAGPRKPDPHSVDMNAFRAAVAGHGPSAPPPPIQLTTTPGDDVPAFLIARTDGAVFFTDGITKRRVADPSEYAVLGFLGQARNTYRNGVPDIPVNDAYLAPIPDAN